MTETKIGQELERRILLLEDPTSGEQSLDDLPVRDVVMAVVGLAVLTIVMLVWGYPR